MSIKHILFDLDGTLTDPGEGITNSVSHALRTLGHTPGTRSELERFIGPPLDEAFGGFYGFDEEKIARAVTLFREYFAEQGIWENVLYPGIPELLLALEQRAKGLYVATSKPTQFANQILQHFDIASYFADVEGSPLTHNGLPKAQVIEAVLGRNNILPGEAIMVGDRKHDIIGAAKTGLLSVGVLYGYGSREEFEEAGADYIVESVAELEDLLLSF